MSLLTIEGLAVGYGEADVLSDVTLELAEGEIVTVVGPNGAGKSTLLKAVMGLLPPRRGRIVLAGAEIGGLRPDLVVRRGVAYVPQVENVFPSLTVHENLEMGAWTARRELEAALAEVFRRFPVLEVRQRQRAGTLSGGERQMVAIAMALMVTPRVLMLDEPSAGLAPAMVDTLFGKIREVNGTGIAMLLVEQNAREALRLSSRGYVLVAGRNRLEGPGPVLADDPDVRALFLGG
jgi:ABC-type branched-subunit amino acid transport system ATPase component